MILETRALRVRRVTKVMPVRQVPLDRRELLDRKETLVTPDLLVRKVKPVRKALKEFLELMGWTDHRDSKGTQAIQDRRVRKD